MCVYIYACMWVIVHFVWWICEQPSLVISALDLVMWACAQGSCCRCMLILYCVHDHRRVIILIHFTWVTSDSPCKQLTSICLKLWRALTHPSTSMLSRVIYTGVKPCQCTIAHQTWNSAEFLLWKWCTSVVVFSQLKLGENSVLCAMTHLRRSVAGFPPRK